MSFKSRDLTVKLSEGEKKCGCTSTQPGCDGCTNTQPDCGDRSRSDEDVGCTKTKDNRDYEGLPGQSSAGLALLRQQLQETLGALR